MSDPASMLVALTDAVTAALTAAAATPGAFALELSASTEFDPLTDLSGLSDTAPATVLCLPAGDPEGRMGGGNQPIFEGDYEVDVVIYAKVKPNAAATSDERKARLRSLMLLRQQVRDLFKNRATAIDGAFAPGAVLTGIRDAAGESPAYGQAVLVQKDVFVSSQTLQFHLAYKR